MWLSAWRTAPLFMGPVIYEIVRLKSGLSKIAPGFFRI
jgi:hypothetical protein